MKINVSRFINRERAEFQVEVLTPMFLGGADGNAELRPAPFKNAIRYWWRVAQGSVPHDRLLEKEQKLFGGVVGQATRSLVDVVVTGAVKTGRIKENDRLGEKQNPEANNRNVPLSAYLGMGPVDFNGNYNRVRILPKETFTLAVSFPKARRDEIIAALSLFKAFGGLGARSRNGWGSFDLKSETGNFSFLNQTALFSRFGEDFNVILANEKQYPFRLGTTQNKPLLWKIGAFRRWKEAMEEAGRKYMDLRQQVLPFQNARPGHTAALRHILGYPVTNHSLRDWGGNNGRMPSQLRILIRKERDQFAAYFFHLPHKLPNLWNNQLGSESSVWKKIHDHLDRECKREGDLPERRAI